MKIWLSKIFPVGILLRLVNISWGITIGGKRIKTPVLGGMRLILTEMWMCELLQALLRKKAGTFIDVGVNIGQTLAKVKSIDPSIEYLGFEPNPTCVWYVKELVKVNRFENVMLIPVGLSTENDLVPLIFFHDTDIDSTASIIDGFRPEDPVYQKQYISVINFDNFASKFDLKAISIIKIDVEGSELEVLESLYNTIVTFRPLILLEVLPIYSAEKNVFRKTRQDKIEHLISALNYTTFRVKKTKEDAYGGLQRLETMGVHSDLSQCDYVAVPHELLDTIFDSN